MIQKVKTISNIWLEGYEITIEADSNRSLPTIEIVGLPDNSIKESKERIRSTFRAVWIDLPSRKIVLNLSPSDIKKIGTRFDLPMAVAMLLLVYEWNIYNSKNIKDSMFLGELWLDASIKPINWILPSVLFAKSIWYKNFFVPKENLYELKYIKWINIYPLKNFSELIDFFVHWKDIQFIKWGENLSDIQQQIHEIDNDFAFISGHDFAKRALTLAASGLHNLLLIWPPWSGKTMLCKATQSILPPMTFDEILQVSQIYSVVGKLDKDNPLITQRQFRAVHHTSSKVSIVGGGTYLHPWQISLSHKWILFFDELPEFPRTVLEVVRQPIEDKTINISRASGTVQYPADFMFMASMNPCKCGYYKDPQKQCTCSINDIKKYQSKISWPLLDRFDMILEVPRQKISKIMSEQKEESSASIRKKVEGAWKIQQKRFAWLDITSNSQMGSNHIKEFIVLNKDCKDFLESATKSLNLSPRVVHRIMKLSRTVADLQWSENVKKEHIAESLQYRSKNMFVQEGL